MSQDEYTKLFKYIESFRTDVEKGFEFVRQDQKELRGAIAELAGDLRDYHQELVMLARKVDRLERWIQQVAQDAGVKLEY